MMFCWWRRQRQTRRQSVDCLVAYGSCTNSRTLIQLAISRSREYEADRLGANLLGSGRPLARALQKLDAASKNIPLPVPDSQANMFIVAPFTGSDVARLFMTHPPVEKRVERLLEI